MEHLHRELVHVNNSAVGAHVIAVPSNIKTYPVFLRHQGVPYYIQRQTQYHDWSYVPEWKHPPYEKHTSNPWLGQVGQAHKYNTFPIIY
jgi:hypothetical protein